MNNFITTSHDHSIKNVLKNNVQIGFQGKSNTITWNISKRICKFFKMIIKNSNWLEDY